ncbi:shikimate dehydrogenase [Metallosphaera tengchongensis]|uniref:Shikimate dehydrogenase (NADP(+)) n=1 Tax=Metallosphaera tengchongensis TaxID=1532350 RepID=A0A6N0NVR5_9CREN|nr:shikimate dehydrogenase [Metallosphaera tengchongensis]QKQ99467.1 shikimate dehydrogenase [Metallosphaera tengchongensis]
MNCTSISYETKLLGVLGEKISYSLSPLIHNYSFERLGLNALYVIFDLGREKFQRALPGLLELTYGLNVTIPYKESVIPYLDSLSPEAERIGAVNTVFQGRGYNTDYLAVKSLVGEKYGKALILGAGGAAKAASFALAEMGSRILIRNRTRERSQELVDRLARYSLEAEVTDDCRDDYDIVVNTIPDPYSVPLECVKGKVAIEFVYKDTPFLKLAKERGLRTVTGLEILVRQAMEAEKIWFGKSLDDLQVVNFLNARQLVR